MVVAARSQNVSYTDTYQQRHGQQKVFNAPSCELDWKLNTLQTIHDRRTGGSLTGWRVRLLWKISIALSASCLVVYVRKQQPVVPDTKLSSSIQFELRPIWQRLPQSTCSTWSWNITPTSWTAPNNSFRFQDDSQGTWILALALRMRFGGMQSGHDQQKKPNHQSCLKF